MLQVKSNSSFELAILDDKNGNKSLIGGGGDDDLDDELDDSKTDLRSVMSYQKSLTSKNGSDLILSKFYLNN